MSSDDAAGQPSGEPPVGQSGEPTPNSAASESDAGVSTLTGAETDGDGSDGLAVAPVVGNQAGSTRRQRRTRRRSKGMRAAVEWVAVIVVALLVALGIRQFLFQPFWIPTGSMENTLVAGDRVLVNKAAYRFHDIRRGDVVVFKRPDNWAVEQTVKDLIKRVIGIPGDEVTIRDCSVYVDGRRLVEPYVDDRCTEPASEVVDPDGDGTFSVPDGMVFVMGDNRTGSSDSRVNGFVPEDDVVGRAFVVMWPLKHWRWL